MKWIKRILCRHDFDEGIVDMSIHRRVKTCKKCGAKRYIAFDIQH